MIIFRPLPPRELDDWEKRFRPLKPHYKKKKLHDNLNTFRHFIGDHDITRNYPQFFW